MHESPDYYSLKLSLFNDDKKAELISETWINLDEVLHRGGGQSDGWHSLSFKGKYAGEIRIELTYYDSRARAEKTRDSVKERKRSVIEATNAEAGRATLGPRQLPAVKRRPLPNDPVSGSSTSPDPRRGSGQMNQAYTPESFEQQASTMQIAYNTSHENVSGGRSENTAFVQPHTELEPSMGHHMSLRHPSPRRKPVQSAYNSQEAYSTDPEFVDDENSFFEYSDDPYALQAVDAGEDHHGEIRASSWSAQPRHNRIDALAATSPSKPYHPPLPHAQSAPILGDHAHSLHNRDYGNLDHNSHQAIGTSPQNYDDYSNYMIGSPAHKQNDYYDDPNCQFDSNEPPPPPPPTHRNSAPPAAMYTRRNAAAQGNTVPRPLHSAASAGGLHSEQIHYTHRQGPSIQGQRFDNSEQYSTGSPRGAHQRQEWRDSAGAVGYIRPSPQGPSNGRQEHAPVYEYDAVFAEPQYRPDPSNRFLNQQRQATTLPLNQLGGNTQQYRQSPVYTPQNGRSPRLHTAGAQYQNTPAQRNIAPRSSIDHQSQHLRQTTPYSPESYANLNPRSNQGTPAPANAPSPLHSPQPPPTYTGQPAPPPIEASPILRSDGQAVDPADQLPIDSWAPEPERKGGSRPSVVVNVKRFGPRSAPATPLPVRLSGPAGGLSPGSPQTPNMGGGSPGAGRSRLGQPSPRGNNNSPLTPSSSHALNSNFSSAYPPPVPSKIPLGHTGAVEDYGPGGNMTALSQEMQNIELDRERTASGQRVRKSRFGA